MGRFSVNLGVLAAAIALFAQGPEPSGVTIRTTTTLVQVGVVVRDAKGKPVVGLKKEDFEILDNGKPQPIAVFYGVPYRPRQPLHPGRSRTSLPKNPRPAAVIPSSFWTGPTPALATP